MKTRAVLQLLAVALFALGVLAIGVGTSSLEISGINPNDAFAAGVIFSSVGFIMFADVRRRALRSSGSA